jgi:hypothetical protein
MHSARWDSSVDFKGKTVAGKLRRDLRLLILLSNTSTQTVIGTGSSAIQIVPQLQKGTLLQESL